MDVSQSAMFAVLCQTRNMGQAATKLYMSRQALSTRLAKLESEVGAPLFERSRRGLTLTEAGRMMQGYFDACDGLWQETRASIAQLNHVAPLAIRVGLRGINVDATDFENFATFEKNHPGVTVEFADGAAGDFLDMLSAGDIDVAFVRGYMADAHRDPMVLSVCLHANEPRAVVAAGTLEGPVARFPQDFAGMRICRSEGWASPGFERDCAQAGIECADISFSKSAMVRLIRARRLCFIEDAALSRRFLDDGIVELPIEGFPLDFGSYMAYRADAPEVIRELVRFVYRCINHHEITLPY